MRVLLVEDHQIAAEALCSLLEQDGHQVTVALNYHSALDFISVGCCDAAFLDVNLPDGNGKDLVPLIRAKCPDAKVYLASGSSVLNDDECGLHFEDMHEAAAAVGADGCLAKPIQYDKMLALLNSDAQ